MESSITRFTDDCPIAYSRVESVLADSDRWVTTSELRYYIGHYGSTSWVDVYKGFVTDGATVPRWLWWLIPPWGAYGNAVIVHDYLCTHKHIVKDGALLKVSDVEIDDILKESLKIGGVKAWQQKVIYSGVVLYRKLGLRD